MKTTKAIAALLLIVALGAATGATGGAAATGASAEAAAAQPKKAGKKRGVKTPKGVYWGAWIGPQLTGTEAPWDMGAVSTFERLVGHSPSLIEFSSPWRTCGENGCEPNRFPTAAMQSIRDYGAIPVFSWGSQANSASLEQPEFTLAQIAAGAHDAYIAAFATEVKEWGHPFFLRFNWEMNGSWFLWSEGINGNRAGDFVAAWRHVHDVFSAVGADNATWVWCPYAAAAGAKAKLSRYYPGGQYVDWTCLDAYNWGRKSLHPTPWRSFDQLFSSSYRQITRKIAPGKPMMLGELATNGGGKPKAAWIRSMFKALPKRYPKVHGLVWFNCPDRGMSWTLESSPAGLKAFAKGIGHPRYRGSAFASLSASPIPAPR